MNWDQEEVVSEEEIKAIQKIEKLRSVKRFFRSKAAFLLTFLSICFLLMIMMLLCLGAEFGWVSFYVPVPLLLGLAYIFSIVDSFADKRIKRCEDQVLTGVFPDSEKLTSGQLMWRVCGVMFFIGCSCLYANIVLFWCVLPSWAIIPGAILSLCLLFVLGTEALGVVLSIAVIIIGAATGSAPWYLYILPVSGLLLLVLPYLFVKMQQKKNISQLEMETKTHVIPALSQIMTIDKFDSNDHVPYFNEKCKKIEGNCYIAGRWHGREVRFSNLSFTATVVKENKQLFGTGLINAGESFCGVCVSYLAGGKVTDRMIDYIKYNLQSYGVYDVFVGSSNKVTVLLNRGYYFIENPKISSVSHSDQLRIDVIKLDNIFKAIQSGLLQKQMPPRIPAVRKEALRSN